MKYLFVFLTFVFAIFLVFSSKKNHFFTPFVIDQEKLFDLVQRYRYKNGLSPYKKSDFLCHVVDIRLKQTREIWTHDKFIEQMNKGTFCKSCTLGENLSKDFSSEEDNMIAWIKSKPHKQNLDASYTHSCLKCSKDNYCVEIFGYY